MPLIPREAGRRNKWFPEGSESPAIHPTHANTEKREDEQFQNTVEGVIRMMDMYDNDKVTLETLNYCLGYNAEKLDMEVDELRDMAISWRDATDQE